MYKAPHTRRKVNSYQRENKSLVKPHQDQFKDVNGPNIKTKRRPKRESFGGFKMSYRYRYYVENIVEDEEETEEESE